MKKSITIVFAFIVSITFIAAQSDTTKIKTKSTTRVDTVAAWYKSYPNKDMTKLKTTDIPSPLRTTLQGSTYKGWETGTIYQNAKTKEYVLQLPATAVTSSTRNKGWYRFDAEGKAIPDYRKP